MLCCKKYLKEKTENKYKKEARKKEKRADFVISINPKIIIPVEVEKQEILEQV